MLVEWGYFIGHPPSPEETSIVSRLLDIDYTSKICRLAFPKGKVNSALNSSSPDIEARFLILTMSRAQGYRRART